MHDDDLSPKHENSKRGIIMRNDMKKQPENKEFESKYKGPIQELSKLKNEIRQVQQSMKQFDVQQFKEAKQAREEQFERNINEKLRKLNDQASQQKPLTNAATQYKQETDNIKVDIKKKE